MNSKAIELNAVLDSKGIKIGNIMLRKMIEVEECYNRCNNISAESKSIKIYKELTKSGLIVGLVTIQKFVSIIDEINGLIVIT